MSHTIAKHVVIKLFVLCFVADLSSCHCPQVSFDTLLVRFCNGRRKCIDRVTLQDCVDPEMVLDDTAYLEIFSELGVLRRGFVHDLPKLTRIYAVANNITRILPGAFLNLPRLDAIVIADSALTEILWGVFNNMSMSTVDLNENLISFIENEAFSNMPNLKSLNLEKNRLKKYQKRWLLNSHNLEKLSLAYNQLETIPIKAFNVFPNLKYLDLSFNKLKQLGSGIFTNVRKVEFLDLTSNKLWFISEFMFGTCREVEEVRLPLNYLSFLDVGLLNNGNVRSLVLHPNPWQCICLEEVLNWMRTRNATLKDASADTRMNYQKNTPECTFSPRYSDKCFKGEAEKSLKPQDLYFNHVKYSDWEYEVVTRRKTKCSCV